MKACGEGIEGHLEKRMKELENFTETLPENEENVKLLEKFENTALEGKWLLNQLKGKRKAYQRQIEVEEKGKKKNRQMNVEEKEKQLK